MASSSSALMFSVVSKTVTLLLSSIVKIAQEIREVVKRVKVNKHQCLRLSERIHIIVGFLKGKQFNNTLDASMDVALINFAEFLKKCLKFINTFTDAGFWNLLWNNKDYFLQFTELHTELTQYTTDINFAMQLADKLPNKSQNQCDLPTILDCGAADCKEQQQNIFESGVWIYRRCLNEEWQNVFHCDLIFDLNTERVAGFGDDNLGHFKLDGTFNCSLDKKFQAVEMTWQYKDHLQIIQLLWDKDRNVLRGTSFYKKKITDQICQCMGQFEMAFFAHSLE